jgi:hypothetical protein
MALKFDLGSRRVGILVRVWNVHNLFSCLSSHRLAARCGSSADTIYKSIGIYRNVCLIVNNLHLVFFGFFLFVSCLFFFFVFVLLQLFLYLCWLYN